MTNRRTKLSSLDSVLSCYL